MNLAFSTRTIAICSLLTSCLALSLMGLGSAFGNSNEILGCVNKKTLVLRVSSKCTKDETKIKWNVIGPQGLQGEPGAKGDVGPAGPQGIQGVKGESAKTSFNLLLRDASGKLVEDLVSDGYVFKDAKYWNLDYETGKFTPPFDYLYPYFFDAACKTEPVIVLYSFTPAAAERELEKLKSRSKSMLSTLWSGETRLDTFYYKVPQEAKVVDNRSVSTGPEWYEWSLKRNVYQINSQLDKCEQTTTSFFYIDGITQVPVVIPDSLPAPIKWSRE